MKSLIIIGARGFGREVFDLAKECSGFGSEFYIKGFLDDKKDALVSFSNYPPILDSVEKYKIQENDIFVCALGDVVDKKKYVSLILAKGGAFMNIVHPSSYIETNTKMGMGCIVGRFVFISCDISIGNFVTIQPHVTIGHDCVVGDWCMLNSYAFLGGGVVVGAETVINTSAKILPKKKVGQCAVIGAGSIVIKNVKENTTVFGNPAVEL